MRPEIDMLERTVEKALLGAVSAAGGIAYKFTSPARRGVPDRLIVLPGGRVFFVECKAPGGRLSALQVVEIDRLRRLGAEVVVVCSVEQARALV